MGRAETQHDLIQEREVIGKQMEGHPQVIQAFGLQPEKRSAEMTFAVKPLLTDKQARPY